MEPGDHCLLSSPARKEYLHRLRQFLRHVVARKLARDRPRAYDVLQAGWSEDGRARALQTALMRCPYGPALMCGGQRSRAMILAARHCTSGTCLRCGLEDENLQHRLWTCPANERHRLCLDGALPNGGLPADLPTCLLRTGLTPRTGSPLSIEATAALLVYLRVVSEDAARCMARCYRGLPTAGAFAADICPRALATVLHPVRVPQRPAPAPDVHCDELIQVPPGVAHVYVDGAYLPGDSSGAARAGLGFLVVGSGPYPLALFGPITADEGAGVGTYSGRISNSVAELLALRAGLQIVGTLLQVERVAVFYDSRYAGNLGQQRSRPRTHLPLVQTVVDMAARVIATRVLPWHWIRGHGANAGNRWVDRIARMGADGIHLDGVDTHGLPAA